MMPTAVSNMIIMYECKRLHAKNIILVTQLREMKVFTTTVQTNTGAIITNLRGEGKKSKSVSFSRNN